MRSGCPPFHAHERFSASCSLVGVVSNSYSQGLKNQVSQLKANVRHIHSSFYSLFSSEAMFTHFKLKLDDTPSKNVLAVGAKALCCYQNDCNTQHDSPDSFHPFVAYLFIETTSGDSIQWCLGVSFHRQEGFSRCSKSWISPVSTWTMLGMQPIRLSLLSFAMTPRFRYPR